MTITDLFGPETDETTATPAPQGGLRDTFGSGEFGAPAISWTGKPVGTSFKFIVLPAPVPNQAPGCVAPFHGEAHNVTQQTMFKVGTPLYFKPKNGVGQGNPRTQTEITLLTDQTGYALMSAQASSRQQERGVADNGERRLIVKAVNEKTLKAAITAAGASGPEVGAYGVVTLSGSQPNAGGNDTPLISVQWLRPTAASLAKVQEHLAAEKAKPAPVAPQQNIVPQTQTDLEPPF